MEQVYTHAHTELIFFLNRTEPNSAFNLKYILMCIFICVCVYTHAHRVDLYHLYCATENGAIHTCPLFPMTTKGSQ